MKLCDLNYMQRQHLAWRLDVKTACGLITACRIARLGTEFDKQEVYRVFVWAGKSDRSAKIHARKVINYGN
jgi:hypothetical protein